MPLGFERLNVRRQPPNKLITFVAALDGPDKAIAQDFLERIAAIVYPVMRDNGLAVMSLDEFPSNREFWGRNFNAGECIQIVLKNPNTGLWLPFQFVQGVMIHELAHIKQMNHSRAFWSVNNKLSAELRVLRSKGYTGEGFWSTGRTLISSEYTQDRPLAESDMPHSLCGGTYRSRTRVRKNKSSSDQAAKKPKPTYAEIQQRKKERKFGTGEGNKVGGDECTRSKLEKGAKSKSAPKIAQSVRGRELRAAAALKRFEGQVKEEEEEEDSTGYSEAEDDRAIDVGGGKILIPVSKEEDGEEEEEMKKELLELVGACRTDGDGDIGTREDEGQLVVGDSLKQRAEEEVGAGSVTTLEDGDGTLDRQFYDFNPRSRATSKAYGYQPKEPPARRHIGETLITPNINSNTKPKIQTPVESAASGDAPCSCCSVVNDPSAVLCIVCANVLEPDKMPNSWKCPSAPCIGSSYVNAGDAGVCGVCGQRKSK